MGDLMANSKKKVLIALFIFSCLFLFNCSKLTQENYEKIKLGMGYEEVADILGQAKKCDSSIGVTNCRWESNGKYIKIQFIADKLVLFSAKGLS
jgi:hypothetical protein